MRGILDWRRSSPPPPARPVAADRVDEIYEWMAVTGELPPHLSLQVPPPLTGPGAP